MAQILHFLIIQQYSHEQFAFLTFKLFFIMIILAISASAFLLCIIVITADKIISQKDKRN